MARLRQDTPEEARHQRETASAIDRFRQRKSWLATERARLQANWYQMALDEDYYDSTQWTPDEAAAGRAFCLKGHSKRDGMSRIEGGREWGRSERRGTHRRPHNLQ